MVFTGQRFLCLECSHQAAKTIPTLSTKAYGAHYQELWNKESDIIRHGIFKNWPCDFCQGQGATVLSYCADHVLKRLFKA